jgi:hypothetical protein
MARAPPIFPHAETSACPAVGQLGNRLADLFGQRLGPFAATCIITVETGLAGARSRRTSRYFHLPPDGTHEGGGSDDDAPNATPICASPSGKCRGCSAATPHRDNLVTSAPSRGCRAQPTFVQFTLGQAAQWRSAGIACGFAVVPYKIPDLWGRARSINLHESNHWVTQLGN